MSTTIDDARQLFVDERLPELEELSNRRDDLLREMFRLMQYAGSGTSSALLEEPDTGDEELERFLDRFDLRKNPETGSILSLDIPELRLGTSLSREPSPAEQDEEPMIELPLGSDVSMYPEGGSEDLQYPMTSPLQSRVQKPTEEEADEDPEVDVADMDVDVTGEEDERSASGSEEEDAVNVEDEDVSEQVSEPRTPPRRRSRTDSLIPPRRRKRRRSYISDEEELDEEVEPTQEPVHEVRQTRSKSRRLTTPPVVAPAEDEDLDELDIISHSPASRPSPPVQRSSTRHVRSRTATSEVPSARESSLVDEQNAEEEDTAEGEAAEILDVAEQESDAEAKFVPASPSTPSLPSSSMSPSPQLQEHPERRASPIRAPRLLIPEIPDTTPLPPPRSPPPPIIVHLPVYQPERPVYRFDDPSALQTNEPEVKTENEGATALPGPEQARTSLTMEQKLLKRPAFNYSLPPPSALPSEFNRKAKPQKRKRDKERERTGSENGKKDDWLPLGMSKWAALLYANPAYRKLARATKCVGTKDWSTASTELKLIRTLERIDVLKRTGKWSFRQLKKQRVAAGLVKTHWDYVMDEMKWMQVDFREERRWKIAVAYELALSVQEWHLAGSHEERIRLGICAPWRKPDPLEMLPMEDQPPLDVDIGPDPMEESEDEEQDALPAEDMQPEKDTVDDTASDNEEDEDQRAVTAALILDSTIVDAVDFEQPFTVPDEAEVPSITMKLEEVEGADALRLAESSNSGEGDQSSSQFPPGSDERWNELPKTEVMDTSQALKETSNNPILNYQSAASTSAPEPAAKEQKSLWTPEQTKILRSSILSLDDESLFTTLGELVALSDEQLAKSLASEDDSMETDPTFDWTAIFPELQPFSLLDVPNSEIVGNSSDGKKKGDKKADKDDPTKRVEETTYTRLCPTNRFMHMKPVLVSALQPAKKWRKGKWIDLDESPVVSDVDGPPNLHVAENSCSLFEGRRITIPFQPPLMLHNFSKIPRAGGKMAEIPWSSTEDNMLKSLAERYPSNWRLVADALNSSRIRTNTDLRTPLECFERWRTKCGVPTRSVLPPGVQLVAPFVNNEEGTASQSVTAVDTPPPSAASIHTTTSQMTTRGVKRLATTAAQNALNLTVNTGFATVESRKRKRHSIIYHAMKKTSDKRQRRKQDEQKHQTSSAAVGPVHDTHHQFGTKTRYSPLELSQMKAERERKEFELQQMRRREMDTKRQQQQQQLHAQLQQAHQQQQQMGQQGTPLQQGVQGVPQIRTQMMQAQVAQQARALAQVQAQAQVQSQGQQQQTQPNLTQIQGQMANSQANLNGSVQHLSAPYVNHGGASSPVSQQASPPRSVATPVNSVATFPRPSSAQRNVTMPGAQVLPMTTSSIPIARTNNALAAYFANASNGVQYTPDQMSQLMRYQQAQQAQQAAQQAQQQQMQMQQQQPVQMQMQAVQQNTHQGSIGYPPTGQ